MISSDVSPLLNKDIDAAEKAMEACEHQGIRIMTLSDGDYPQRLRNIPDPPVLLYIKGRMPPVDEKLTIGIVGTRNCTPYGVITAERMAYDIARGGGMVVSGLAKGIDSAAAIGAMQGDGKVIGVLGCGIDVIYPRSNRELYRDVALTGALISEYPPGTSPEGRNFPVRNRIISGLSAGVLVVEAPEKSGALITASHALEQGRDVFAVPGNIDAQSCRGTNELLREGASIALSGRDILESYIGIYDGITLDGRTVELNSRQTENSVENQPKDGTNGQKAIKKVIDKRDDQGYIDLLINRSDLSNEEVTVLEAMDREPSLVDDIILKSGLSPETVISVLTILQIKGAVSEESGRRYASHVKILDR